MSANDSSMSALAAYALGAWGAEARERHKDIVAGIGRNRERNSYEQRIDRLVAKGEEFLEHIEWQKGIMDQRKARIAELETILARRDAKLAEWEQYADEKEADHARLRAWSNDAETRLQRYHALYGPLPADKTSEK